jgi:hypothetical protein
MAASLGDARQGGGTGRRERARVEIERTCCARHIFCPELDVKIYSAELGLRRRHASPRGPAGLVTRRHDISRWTVLAWRHVSKSRNKSKGLNNFCVEKNKKQKIRLRRSLLLEVSPAHARCPVCRIRGGRGSHYNFFLPHRVYGFHMALLLWRRSRRV